MSLNFTDVWNFVVPFITIAAFGALFLVYGTTKTLRDTNADLRAQHEDDKARLAERDAEIAKMKQNQAEMEGRIGVLESLVTGAVNWTAISDQLEVHHKEALAHWSKALEQWSRDEHLLVEILRETTRNHS
jgi:hypothetical protein